jgi:hypothetical protein
MKPSLFYNRLDVTHIDLAAIDVNEDVMKKINGLKRNGPARPLSADQVHAKKLVILGPEPTSHLSIHPEGEVRGKRVSCLSQLARLAIGSPMVDGHRRDTAPWGRIYSAQVETVHGYPLPVLTVDYFFLKGFSVYDQIAAEIDAGIRAEWSISYWFSKAHCGICHKEFMMTMFGPLDQKCGHKIGQKDAATGEICYWYPNGFTGVAEVSSVYAGAYRKTKNLTLTANYAPDEEQASNALSDLLKEHSNAEGNEGNTQNSGSETTETETPENQAAHDGVGSGGISSAGTDASLSVNPPPMTDTTNSEGGAAGPAMNAPGNEGAATDATAAGAAGVSPASSATELAGSVAGEAGVAAAAPGAGVPEGSQNEGVVSAAQAAVPEAQPAGVSPEPASSMPAAQSDGAESGAASGALPAGAGEAENEHSAPADSSLSGAPAGRDLGDLLEVYDEIMADESLDGDERDCAIGDAFTDEERARLGLAIDCAVVIDNAVVGPLKPAKSGAQSNEYFALDDFVNLPDGVYFVEPKYDGVYLEAHRIGGAVKLFSDEGNEHTKKFPAIVAELEKLAGGDYVLPGEMVKYRGRQRMTHEDVNAYIHSKSEAWEDQAFRFKPHDAIKWDGENLRAKPLAERREEFLSKVSSGKQVHPTSFTKVTHKSGDERVVKAIQERSTREGAMVKSGAATYNRAGSKLVYKYKRQYVLDVKTTAKKGREGGGFVYTCEVGRGTDATEIGETYTTKKDVPVGTVLAVSVDKVSESPDKPGTYTWTAPKVIGDRPDKKQPDPLSVVKRIVADSHKPDSGSAESRSHAIQLGDVLPRLKRIPDFALKMHITGGLAENGQTTNDIDIVVDRDPTDAERAAIDAALGELAERVDICVDPTGPAGPRVEVVCDIAAAELAWKHAKRFVLQKHWWGAKAHWDLRFGAPKTPRMWGWTCFSEPTKVAGGPKVRCVEKTYHDPKWMDVDGKIKPGEIGNPTKNLTAYMKIIDAGTYEFIRRKPGFLEVVLKGDKWSGRYVFREIEVKGKKDEMVLGAAASLADDDEAGRKNNKIWVMWKPKDQTTGKAINELEYRIVDNHALIWERGTEDHAVLSLPDELPEEGVAGAPGQE